ncbi:hypothetical protein P7K49_011347 [Saguinus oedipus]|uniref:MHC class I-like antigen recognition-like domain-containing protein n=1 Tax=Saguinus oedipus TaxID=9490 RepID=A0ABQ9VQF8_SAGOE|nr:hypothetical protein P7K49_011347 [Saguinus oedipus]
MLTHLAVIPKQVTATGADRIWPEGTHIQAGRLELSEFYVGYCEAEDAQSIPWQLLTPGCKWYANPTHGLPPSGRPSPVHLLDDSFQMILGVGTKHGQIKSSPSPALPDASLCTRHCTCGGSQVATQPSWIADEEYLEVWKECSQMLLSSRYQLLIDFSFWNKPQPRGSPNIYELGTCKLKPGTMNQVREQLGSS